MPTPFPIVFSELPSGEEPLILWDEALLLSRTPSYFEPSGVVPGTYGDTTHVPVLQISGAGVITSASLVPVSGGGGGGNTVINTAGGTIAVDAATSLLILNAAAPGVVVLNLGAVAARAGLGLTIVDWLGNCGTITVNPVGGETIMGLPTAGVVSSAQGVGTGAVLRLVPNVTLSGWVQV